MMLLLRVASTPPPPGETGPGYVYILNLCHNFQNNMQDLLQAIADPFAKKDKVGNSPKAGNSPVAERPGVGRKKAADLPDAGYVVPSAAKKGCCGCVVM